jgi:DNA repair ATPase RecN
MTAKLIVKIGEKFSNKYKIAEHMATIDDIDDILYQIRGKFENTMSSILSDIEYFRIATKAFWEYASAKGQTENPNFIDQSGRSRYQIDEFKPFSYKLKGIYDLLNHIYKDIKHLSDSLIKLKEGISELPPHNLITELKKINNNLVAIKSFYSQKNKELTKLNESINSSLLRSQSELRESRSLSRSTSKWFASLVDLVNTINEKQPIIAEFIQKDTEPSVPSRQKSERINGTDSPDSTKVVG